MAFSSVSVRIQDFWAIKDANLKLDGLTVLSGLNGSGKSTIAKTLYYALKVALKYDEILDKQLHETFEQTIHEFLLFADDLLRSMARHKLIEKEATGFLDDDIFTLRGKTRDDILIFLRGVLDKLGGIAEKINADSNESRRKILLPLLRRTNQKLTFSDDKPSDPNMPQQKINETFFAEAERLLDANEKKKERRAWADFIKLCDTDFNIKIPKRFSYAEDDVEIFDKAEERVRPIRDIKSVYYIDTPWIIDFPNRLLGLPHAHWNDTLNQIYFTDNLSGHAPFSEKIAETISGYASRKEGRMTLFFDRADGEQFFLRDTATGIKNFSIIQRLAERRVFDDKTLLILDEPESHLHPQWIVEYARILVLMQKELGVRLLIASHSPDMIDALQTFSESAGIAERTNFYLAEESEKNSFKYSYTPLGNSIAEIFKAFNVAATRIADYEKDLGKNAD